MANIKSAKKRILVIEKKTAQNRAVKNGIKTVLKSYEKAMAAGDIDAATEARNLAEKKLKQAASKNTISKQAASRKVSQITKRLNAAKAEK